MITIKAYTDLEQSRKLAEILPFDSADMWYENIGLIIPRLGHIPKEYTNTEVPCWSLAALLEQFPYELCDDDGNSSYLQIDKEDDVYQLAYINPNEDFESIETDRYEHFIDACYEMILKLHELNLL